MNLLGKYPYKIINGHHRANEDGAVYEHVLAAEEKLGRELLDEEVVHHIDGDKTNNTMDNLMVFATRGDHTRFHRRNIAINDLTKTENGSYTTPQRMNVCCNCGSEISKKAVRCVICDYEMRKERRKVKNRPERDELKKLVRTMPFVEIGKLYGVSDKAIAKWCVQANLPSKVKDIRALSDQEWSVA